MTQSDERICQQLMLTNSPKDTHHIIMKALDIYGEYKVSIQNKKKEKPYYGRI